MNTKKPPTTTIPDQSHLPAHEQDPALVRAKNLADLTGALKAASLGSALEHRYPGFIIELADGTRIECR